MTKMTEYQYRVGYWATWFSKKTVCLIANCIPISSGDMARVWTQVSLFFYNGRTEQVHGCSPYLFLKVNKTIPRIWIYLGLAFVLFFISSQIVGFSFELSGLFETFRLFLAEWVIENHKPLGDNISYPFFPILHWGLNHRCRIILTW